MAAASGPGPAMVGHIRRALDLKPHRERHTHDYRHPGTTSLFAALDIVIGEVPGACRRRHRVVGFRNFLRLIDKAAPSGSEAYPALDKHGTRKTAMFHQWLVRHPASISTSRRPAYPRPIRSGAG